jgi:hypothetical protein
VAHILSDYALLRTQYNHGFYFGTIVARQRSAGSAYFTAGFLR